MAQPIPAQAIGARTKGQIRQLRNAGHVPVSVYHKGAEPLHLETEAKPLDEFIRAHGEAALLEIAVDGKRQTALVHDVQRDPITRRLLHVSLQRVVKGDTLKVHVPLVFHGEPDAVRSHTAVVQHAIEQVEVRCDPQHLPDHITVEIGNLAFGESLRVADLPPHEGVEILTPPDTVLVSLTSLLKQPDAEAEAPASVETAAAATEGFAVAPGQPHLSAEPAAE